ncbi:hypothetical protein [Pseudoduganella sp. R-34]|uniref:hypothetical protein n=1 Tax=Pseudoduganella sp. R-34 TaxID=3404062 RepID=UPI003CEA02F2
MQLNKILISLAWLAFAGNAAALSCDEQLGKAKAAELVKQCKNVSPATRPPCNAANSCEMITDEIKRGCKILGDDAPAYCPPVPTELVKGKLVGGGGLDNYSLKIRTENGKEIQAYCTTHCGDWFTEPDKDDVVSLKPSLRGKPVSARIATERNNGRIAGPDDADRLVFIKSAAIGGN